MISIVKKNLIKAAKLDFNKCDNCGALCCLIAGYIDASIEEYKAIIKLDISYKDNFINYRIKKLHNGIVCPFLIDAKCSIYNVRPKTCVDYDCKDDIDTLNIKNILFPRKSEITL